MVREKFFRSYLRKIGHVIFLIFLLFPWQGMAASVNTKQEILDRAESYLKSLSTLQARFDQISSTGDQASGTFYLDRVNRRFRLEYDPPAALLLIARENQLIQIDQELGEDLHLNLQDTPASILLNPEARFSDIDSMPEVIVTDHTLEITLNLRDDLGTISLTFQEKPLDLVGWSVIDAQGIITNVVLDQMVKGKKLEPILFEYQNPNFFKTPKPRRPL